MENNATYTVKLTEREVQMLYRACMARAYHFVEKYRETANLEEYKTNLDVANRYLALAQNILTQTTTQFWKETTA